MQMSMCVRTEHVRARGFIRTSLTLPLHHMAPHLPPLAGILRLPCGFSGKRFRIVKCDLFFSQPLYELVQFLYK
jgi:hypothetical protein